MHEMHTQEEILVMLGSATGIPIPTRLCNELSEIAESLSPAHVAAVIEQTLRQAEILACI